MRREKWNLYLDTLQGHPSVCQSTRTIADMKFIKELIPPNRFRRMLNIGAGEGLETQLLQYLGYDVIGMIRGETNLNYAYENFPGIIFIDGDMHDLPFPSESFDAIYTNHTFEHAYAPFIFLLELYCILKVGGRMWIAMPDFREITDNNIGDEGKIGHHHPSILCPNLFRQLFNTTGFKILSGNNNNNDNKSNSYLLEKQDLSYLHSDVRTAIKKRKEFFG
jgi:ubiquinone/menaquinone biosynthesis C-methylase UbiE